MMKTLLLIISLIVVILAITLIITVRYYRNQIKKIKEQNTESSRIFFELQKEINAQKNYFTQKLKRMEEQKIIAEIHARDYARALEESAKSKNTNLKIVKIYVTPAKMPPELSMREYFLLCGCKKWNYIDFTHQNNKNRINRSLTHISVIEYSPKTKKAKIQGETDVYETTLETCTCRDFDRYKIPCKHMYCLVNYLVDIRKKHQDELFDHIGNLSNEDFKRIYSSIILKQKKIFQNQRK